MGKYYSLTLSQTSLVFTCLQYKSFENTAGEGEIARNEQFLLSHNVFNPFEKLPTNFIKLKIVVCKLFHFENFTFGKGLIFYYIREKLSTFISESLRSLDPASKQ